MKQILMKQKRIVMLSLCLVFAVTAFGEGAKRTEAASATVAQQSPQPPAPRTVDLKTSDGVMLKAIYFAAAKPGPGVLLLHQSNRTRKSWDQLASQLAAAGFNTLTLDLRGFGESDKKLRDAEQGKRRGWPDDVDAALQYLIAQPGVNRDMIGLGGAGGLGVDNSVDAVRRHPTEIKSLVLISGETLRDGLQFLHEARQLPELFVFSDDDEYPP